MRKNQESNRGQSGRSIRRRGVLKNIGTVGTAVIGTSAVTGLSSADDPGSGDYTKPPGGGGSSDDYHEQTSDYNGPYQSHTTNLVSGLQHFESNWIEGGNYWNHTFRVAGHGVALENGKVNDITSHNVLISGGNENNSILTSRSKGTTAGYPRADGVPDDDVVSVGTGLISGIATIMNSTVTSLALSGSAIVEGMLNGATKFLASGHNSYEFGWVYTGEEEISHHVGFDVHEFNDGSNSQLTVRSECGNAINQWEIELSQGTAYINPQ